MEAPNELMESSDMLEEAFPDFAQTAMRDWEVWEISELVNRKYLGMKQESNYTPEEICTHYEEMAKFMRLLLTQRQQMLDYLLASNK